MYEGGALKYLEWAGKQIPLKLHGGHSNRLVFLFLDGVHKLSFPKIWVALWVEHKMNEV